MSVPSFQIAALGASDLEAICAMHQRSFDPGWSREALTTLMESAGILAIGALAGDEAFAGFILIRVVVDEAEILTLAVDPAWRRQGMGAALVAQASLAARASGAKAVFLEVAERNIAARQLYAAHGFLEFGRRRAYYASGEDALLLKLDLEV